MAEAKILTPELPPESTYPVQLTLTRFEAELPPESTYPVQLTLTQFEAEALAQTWSVET